MRLQNLILILLVFVSTIFCVEAKSTMEQLINKEWYELDFKTMKAHEAYYVKFTGTQRLIVGEDQDGNMKMRVQRYYLTNRWEERYDTTKVGKSRNGKYLVLQGERDGKNGYKVICHEIITLTENRLQTKNLSLPNLEQKVFFTVEEFKKKNEKDGTIISTRDLLANKLWFMLDENGNRTDMEWSFDYGSCYKCQMPKNRLKEFPKWARSEYYLSNEIVTDFNRKMVESSINGIYLVINDREEDEWQVRTYDIKTLSADRLMLECVYPPGEKNLIFESFHSRKNAKETKMKPQQKNLMGKEWFRIDTTTWRRSEYVETFTETHITRSFPSRKNGELVNNKFTFEYYMSNQPAEEFDWRQKGNNPEGDYLVVNEPDADGKYRAVNYKIMSLEGRNMFTINVSHPDNVMHIYERDKMGDEKSVISLVDVDSINLKKTIKSMVVGRQMFFIRRDRKKAFKADKLMDWPRYHTETEFVVPEWRAIKGGYICDKLEPSEWFLSDHPLTWKNSKLENGIYWTNYNPIRRTYYTFKIVYLSETLIVMEGADDSSHRVVFVFE